MPNSDLLAALQDPESFRDLIDERLLGAMREAIRRTGDRCCPRTCDYRPEAVQVYLDMVMAMELAGEDPSEVAACKPPSRNGGGGSAGDGATRIWDVQCAVKKLRARHQPVTAEAVAALLCPWSLEE